LGKIFAHARKFCLCFWGTGGGKSENFGSQDKAGEKGEAFLKTNELSIEGENHTRPVNFFSLPKQAYERAEPKRGERSKTTVASTTRSSLNFAVKMFWHKVPF
jgi:hypothetical protein